MWILQWKQLYCTLCMLFFFFLQLDHAWFSCSKQHCTETAGRLFVVILQSNGSFYTAVYELFHHGQNKTSIKMIQNKVYFRKKKAQFTQFSYLNRSDILSSVLWAIFRRVWLGNCIRKYLQKLKIIPLFLIKLPWMQLINQSINEASVYNVMADAQTIYPFILLSHIYFFSFRDEK